MTQEEKAKAYDEALKKARQLCLYPTTGPFINDLQDLFPELKESEDEDERMKKSIIQTLKKYSKCVEDGNDSPSAKDFLVKDIENQIAWLEKQDKYIENNEDDSDIDFTIYHPLKNGEGHYKCIPYSFYGVLSSFSEDKDMIDFLHLCFYTEEECNEWIKQNESTDTLEHKFNVGDWVIYMGTTAKILDLQKHYYVGKDTNGKDFVVSYCNECEMKKWDISDAKDGDILSNGQMIVIFKHFEEPVYRQHIVAYIGLDINGNIQITDDTWNFGIDKAKPASKEQCNILFTKMKEIGYEWDADKKELKKIEQKSANKNLTNVDHEYYSDLLSNDDSDNIDDYAYQCTYCMSHDWMKESATWEDVQYAVKLGAEWQKQKPAWSEEDEEYINDLIGVFDGQQHQAHSDEEVVNWLKSIRLQYNKEWGKRDEEMLKSIIATCELACEDRDSSPARHLLEMQTNWLKSLKQEIGWKPSEEQMDALYEETQKSDRIRDDRIVSLYNDLKKLKGE